MFRVSHTFTIRKVKPIVADYEDFKVILEENLERLKGEIKSFTSFRLNSRPYPFNVALNETPYSF